MLCAELEQLEAKFDDIITELEDLSLPEQRRQDLQRAYDRMIGEIVNHQTAGHQGKPCFEQNGRY
jgi:hypothetical protein